jgi:cytochrome c551/c552
VKRILAALLAVLILTPVLAWAGFRIWLGQQPNEFRASIEAFSTLEFAEVVVNVIFPAPQPDRAGAGRREYPGRGHSPWVTRSSLDGRPRMISIALAPNLWLAYSTETASIHQLWQGDLDFTGPVYDARHGYEPQSRGDAFLQPSTPTAWRIQEGPRWARAQVQWRGHGFDPETGFLWLRYELSNARGESRIVTEWPDFVPNAALGYQSTFMLSRRIELSEGPPLALAIGKGDIERPEDLASTPSGNQIIFSSESKGAQHSFKFAKPMIPIHPDLPEELADDPFADYDCHTCHNIRERVVGPAWSEIALRYSGKNREVTLRLLAKRIINGSEGRWGSVPMIPHPDLTLADAIALATKILETEPAEAPIHKVPGEPDETEATWTFRSETEEPPVALHPSLVSTPLDSEYFTPKVGGLAWLPDGRLAVATWDQDGAVFAVEGWRGPSENVKVTRIAEGLHEPLGLAVAEGALYVMQKQEITQLIDHDGDDWVDEYRTLTNDWRVTSNFHEFGFGLVSKDGHLYGALSVCVLSGGKSCRDQTPDRGKVFRASIASGDVEIIASGFRTPNGLALSPSGELFVADNQGDWLPASKLIHIREGAHYGWRAPGESRNLGPVTPPSLWLPQNEIGNSPTQPLFLDAGPYKGHVLFGDIFNGGIKRAFLEEVEGELQGAAFHFTGGLEGPVNRLLASPGGFIAGQIGQGGNWGETGKDRFGLESIQFKAETAFEPLRVLATPDGFDIHFSRPLAAGLTLDPGLFRMSDWYYVPSEIYGGPKYDLRDLTITRSTLSPDRRVASLVVKDLKPGRVVYLHLAPSIRSEAGESLWVNEAWYTLNAIPHSRRAIVDLPSVSGAMPNTLSQEERGQGWQLLFDGVSFAGWKIYGAPDSTIEHWEIEDGALKFTRDVGFAGMIWNHLSPFRQGAVDLMTLDRFGDFDLSIDWMISPGGNSGIFYGVPNEASSLSWDFALEMQVLDDDSHIDGQIELHRAGDLYDLQSLTSQTGPPITRPVGEWNRARIRVEQGHIEHWLNGYKTADILHASPAWDRAIAASKFDDTKGFGLAPSGHITLQDHGDVVWYRNIKIRPLHPSTPQQTN